MEAIHVKNLGQHNPGYKDRNLIWCKIYFAMINSDPVFEMLHEVDKWRYIALIMLELQLKQPVPLSEIYLTRKGFDFSERPMSLTLKMLHNLIERVTVDDNACYTQPGHSVYKRREEKSREEKSDVTNKDRLFPIPGKTCGKRDCRLPAVYKDQSGAYDHYYCKNHMPAEVKELYE
jgi:hypothetical protein